MTSKAQSAAARSKAKACGCKTYDGKPCPHHPENSVRWTSNGSCVKCTSSCRPAYLKANAEKLAEDRRAWDRKNPIKAMLQRSRRRAKDAGIEFNLSESDIFIPEFCPVLGIKLERYCGDATPSLDRIDNSKGYVVGNVVVVSFRANRIKSNSTIEELKKVVTFYEQH